MVQAARVCLISSLKSPLALRRTASTTHRNAQFRLELRQTRKSLGLLYRSNEFPLTIQTDLSDETHISMIRAYLRISYQIYQLKSTGSRI